MRKAFLIYLTLSELLACSRKNRKLEESIVLYCGNVSVLAVSEILSC